MIKKDINQNDNLDFELLNLLDFNYIFDEKPIQRIKTKPILEDLTSKLKILKNKIEKIDSCELKNNSSKIVFGDGNVLSPIMIIGDSPSQEDDKFGKPFMDDAGKLLDKMLNAIEINRNSIYITNVTNYCLPLNRKLEQSEINRYSEFLKNHISIIDPKILILMGNVALNALVGNTKKISEERGRWKEVIIGNKNYRTITTFHPAYLLRLPDKKKYSWEDLKKIKQKIKDLNINI